MIKKLFSNDLYIKVSENKSEAKNLSTNGHWESIRSNKPFTTDRLLVGAFFAAEPALSELVKRILAGGFFKKCAEIVIHPMSMTEGGLSEVEERVFKELAYSAGAHHVVLYTGPELSDSAASALLRNKSSDLTS